MIIVLFLIAFMQTYVQAITIHYSDPICLSSGGTFRPTSCRSDQSANIREVFVGRRTKGICGYVENSADSCSYEGVSNADVEALQFGIFLNCHSKSPCTYNFNTISDTHCGGIGYVQVEYYCWTENELFGTNFQIKREFGGNQCFEPSDNAADCAPGTTINLDEMHATLYASSDCSTTGICTINSSSADVFVQMVENCRGKESCTFLEAFSNTNGDILGCSGTSIGSSRGLLRRSYSAMCEGDFDSEDDQISVTDLCIGVSDGKEPVYSEGKETGYKCYKQYVECQSQVVQGGVANTCPTNQLFDFTTHSCQDRDSSFCSVLPPINLVATPDSSTQIQVTWGIDSNANPPDSFTVRAETSDASRVNPSDQRITSSSARDHTLTGLTPNTLYQISMKAHEGVYASTWAQTSAYTYPSSPQVSVGTTTTKSIVFSAQFDSKITDYATFTQIEPINNEISNMTSSGDHVIDSLQPATMHVFNIVYRGMDSGLTSLEDQNLTAVTVPLPVTNLLVDNKNTTDSVEISWTYTGNVDNFQITLTYNQGTVRTETASASARTFSVGSLVSGDSIRVQVTVQYQGKNSAVTTAIGQTLPTKGSIFINDQSASSIEVRWEVSGVSTSYNVELCAENGNLLRTKTVNSPSMSTVFDTLDARTRYIFKLRVLSGVLESLLPKSEVSGFTAPMAVKSLYAMPESNVSITATFTLEVLGGADSYEISFQKTDQTGSSIGKVVTTTPSDTQTLDNLEPATEYDVWIIAIANGIESTAVYNQSFTLPNSPFNIEIENRGEGSVGLTWSHIGNFDDFLLEVTNLDDPESSSFTQESMSKSAVVDGLIHGKKYNFEVWATFKSHRSMYNDSLTYEIPCAVADKDDWNDGKHGKWMIFLIVYCVITTILLIIVLIAICYCCYKYDWETSDNSSSYYISGDDPKESRHTYRLNENNGSKYDMDNYVPPPPPLTSEFVQNNNYSAYMGPEQSTRFDESADAPPPEPTPRASQRHGSYSTNDDAALSIPRADFEIESHDFE